mmetsp:Transcript_34988/g.85747  ORF Transcript_34988/g.85747 Transcript_34988/m.85747 type:complete len:364 (-) Transcript_34988:1923-3014(-)
MIVSSSSLSSRILPPYITIDIVIVVVIVIVIVVFRGGCIGKKVQVRPCPAAGVAGAEGDASGAGRRRAADGDPVPARGAGVGGGGRRGQRREQPHGAAPAGNLHAVRAQQDGGDHAGVLPGPHRDVPGAHRRRALSGRRAATRAVPNPSHVRRLPGAAGLPGSAHDLLRQRPGQAPGQARERGRARTQHRHGVRRGVSLRQRLGAGVHPRDLRGGAGAEEGKREREAAARGGGQRGAGAHAVQLLPAVLERRGDGAAQRVRAGVRGHLLHPQLQGVEPRGVVPVLPGAVAGAAAAAAGRQPGAGAHAGGLPGHTEGGAGHPAQAPVIVSGQRRRGERVGSLEFGVELRVASCELKVEVIVELT